MLAPDAYQAIRIEKRENGVALATLACVVAHFTQVLLDSLLVGRWKAQDEASASGAGRANAEPA